MPGKDPQRAGSKLQALVKTLVDTAIAGDARAQSLLIGALARMSDAEENEAASLTADDQEILGRLYGQRGQGRGQRNRRGVVTGRRSCGLILHSAPSLVAAL